MSVATVTKRILITGANKGIGYEAAKLLAHKLPKATILLGTRSLDNGANAVQRMKDSESQHSFDNVKPIELDVTSKLSITKAAEQVKSEYGSLDVLMCNAGINDNHNHQKVLAVNLDGVHDCIEAFLPIMSQQALIVVVASEVGAWAANEMPSELQQILMSPQSVNWPLIQQLESDWLAFSKGESHQQPWPPIGPMRTSAYGISKALVIAYTRALALQQPHLKVVLVCPGFCATDLTHNRGTRTATKGGESVGWPVLHASEAESGAFYQDGEVYPFVVHPSQRASRNAGKGESSAGGGGKKERKKK